MAGPHRFRIKQGSRLPALRLSLRQGDGSVPTGTLTSPQFRMRSRRGNVVKVALAAAVIVDEPQKVCEYQWAAVDTDTPGVYDAEFVVLLDGKVAIFPAAAPQTDGALEVEVTAVLS